MVAEKIFVNCSKYNFNPISQVKKGSYKTKRSLGRNSDLRLAGSERNNFGPTTLG